jgi:hypothetical protein
MLYVQSLLDSRLYSSTVSAVDFFESSDSNTLVYRFWQAHDPTLFRFELQVFVARPILSHSLIELFMLTGPPGDRKSRENRISFKEFEANLDDVVVSGDVRELYRQAYRFCGNIVLRMLYSKLMSSDLVCKAVEMGLCLNLAEQSVEMSLHDTKWCIHVDSRTGLFTTTSALMEVNSFSLCIFTSAILNFLSIILLRFLAWT